MSVSAKLVKATMPSAFWDDVSDLARRAYGLQTDADIVRHALLCLKRAAVIETNQLHVVLVTAGGEVLGKLEAPGSLENTK